jgi:hypothetical protein
VSVILGLFAAPHMSAAGTVLTKPDLVLCPQLARADMSPPDGNSGYDPGCVKTPSRAILAI